MYSQTVRRLAIAAVASLGLATSAAAQTYDGDWQGTLKAGPQQLKLLLHVKTANGETQALLDIPDQDATLSAGAIKMVDGKINILFLQAMAEIRAGLSQDGKTLNAVWSQGFDLPFTMTKVDVATPAAAPAKPAKP